MDVRWVAWLWCMLLYVVDGQMSAKSSSAASSSSAVSGCAVGGGLNAAFCFRERPALGGSGESTAPMPGAIM